MLANSRVFKDHDQGGGGAGYQVVTMREIRRQKGRHGRDLPRWQQGLRIDPGRLVSKLLDIFNIGARINGGIAVRAALAAQFQHT
jgi:hypothetical protein